MDLDPVRLRPAVLLRAVAAARSVLPGAGELSGFYNRNTRIRPLLKGGVHKILICCVPQRPYYGSTVIFLKSQIRGY